MNPSSTINSSAINYLVAFVALLITPFVCAKDLGELIKSNDTDAVTQYLKQTPLNTNEQASALILATSLAQTDILTLLLSKGLDVNQQDPTRMNATALMYAAYLNHLPHVNLLLDKNANPNIRDDNGDHALNWAVYAGHLEMSQLLVERGARLDISGHGKPNEIAKRRGFQKLVQFLCSVNTCVNEATLPNKIKDSPWDELHKLPKELLSNIDKLDDTGRPFWHQLVRANGLSTLTSIGSHIGDIDQQDDIGFTALMEAAREGHSDIVAWLLKRGAEINLKSHKNSLELTALHLAAIGNCQKCAAMLISSGAHIDAVDTDGTSPLLWGLSQGHNDMAQYLIQSGASTKLKNKFGYNAEMLMPSE